MQRKLLPFFVLTGLLTQPVLPLMAQEATTTPALEPLVASFDPNRILEDEDIFDVNGMGFDRMVRFLRSKGVLADHRTPDIDGVPKTAAEIIWRVSTSYKINPKYLLALLQKEQSLVEDPAPIQKQFDWATGYAICDNCSKDDPTVQEFKGFASQVEWAAKQHREKYLMQILATGKTRAGKAAGLSMQIDGRTITPANNATAMLYAYTPHVHGNQNLWRIWQRWYGLQLPEGTVVRAKGTGKTYLIRMGQKRAYASRAILESLVDPAKVVSVSDTDLSGYPDGQDISFPNYALLQDPKGRIWLISGDSKRRIADMKAFHKFGFNEDEITEVTDEDLTAYVEGEVINHKTEFPQGVVMQDATDKKLWYVEQGVRRPIPDKAYLALYFKGRPVKKTSTKALSKYTVGEPYGLRDGELVRKKSDPSVYVVENGTLRPIPSAEVFERIGWQWKNVVQLPDKVLAAYPMGDPVL